MSGTHSRPVLGALAAIALLLALVAYVAYVAPSAGAKLPAFVVKDPSFSSGKAAVSFPSDYSTLADHLLGEINNVRVATGVGPVTLSAVPSGQQHADSMLFFDYFNHLDPQGYKPYVRYTLLNGTGAAEENIAWQHTAEPSIFTEGDVKLAIDKLEFEMLYDDSLYNWDHRTNILDPHHNGVSIGITYTGTDVYVVEDFENSYISLTSPTTLSEETLTFEGTLVSGTISSAVIYYDPPPQAVDLTQLRVNATLALGYTPGTLLGAVSPSSASGPELPGYTTVASSGWEGGPGAVRVEVPLGTFLQAAGRGVYTVYLQDSSGFSLTSYSVFLG